MSYPAIKAITFDLWDTIIIDDSDEPKRAAQGLEPKPAARRTLVHQALNKHEPISRELVDSAYDVVDAAFRHVWYEQKVTWEVSDRLSVLVKGLKRQLPEAEMKELVKQHEEMELQVRPDSIPGVCEAIERLSKKYKLVIISDTIFSPGRCLRQLLEGEGVLKYFSGLIFSDEAGCCKPDPRVFEAAAKSVDVELNELVHIGDREAKDIAGPHAVGARGILCPIAVDRGDGPNSKADAIVTDFKDLDSILENLN